MPEFRHPAEMEVDRGSGWTRTGLADGASVPGLPMSAWRWDLAGQAQVAEEVRGEPAERFLFVLAGSGWARVGGEEFQLGREDMVWLEPGESFTLAADPGGLAVLEAAAAPSA
jgi:mannose-6-phosphate isomerase-like protein (cupin superfamily)